MGIRILAIDHIVLRTSNVDAMKFFYCDVLNCVVERELEDLGLLQLRAGEALIDLVPVNSELGRLGGQAPVQNGRNMDHFCLQVEKITEAELRAHLNSFEIEVGEFAERYGAEGFGKSLYVNDPEGNIVELKISLT